MKRSDKTEIRRLRAALRWVYGMTDGVVAVTEDDQGFLNMARGHIRETLAPKRRRPSSSPGSGR
jgi:hypothetical protein